MRYGISFPNGSKRAGLRDLVELARLAEEFGWEGVFLEDYIVWQNHPDVPTHDPWVALAAMAMVTGRVRLGTMVTPLPRRRPWKVARELASLDHLSSGRAVLGAGIGDGLTDMSFSGFGETPDAARRGRMLDEALAIVDGLWRGEAFRYEGAHFRVDATLLPRPVQSPRIPIWIGGQFPRKAAMRRASRWDGACLYRADNSDLSASDVRTLAEFVRKERGTLDGYDIVTGGRLRRANEAQERDHVAALAEAGATWWVEWLGPEAGGLEQMRAYVRRGPLAA